MNTTESQTNLAATGSQLQTTSTPDVFEDAKILIDARDAALGLHLRELWNYRELLYFLTWRDIKLRYKQTALGAAWVIIQPLFTMLLFTLFFGKLARMPIGHSSAISCASWPAPLGISFVVSPWFLAASSIALRKRSSVSAG